MKAYANKKGVILLPVYAKNMLVEMSKAEYKRLCEEVPQVKELKVREQLSATERQAMWLMGVKVVQTRNGVFRLF